MTRTPLLLAILATGCMLGSRSSSRDTHEVHLGTLAFQVPDDWQPADGSRRGVAQATYAPAAADNDGHESLTIVRTEHGSPVHDLATLERWLVTADNTSTAEHADGAIPVLTPYGLSGVRLDSTYIPPGQHHPYHRVHAVLLDGDALLHVVYAAQHGDGDLTFQRVLSSMHHTELP